MKYLTKLVTGILLIALAGMPAFAAIPCQQSMRSMPCCDGALCPLMAKVSSNREIGHRGMNNAPNPCCRMHAPSFTAVIDHQSIEPPVAIATFGVGSVVLPMRLAQFHYENVGMVNLRSGPCAQAVLSTFLI